MPRSLGRRPIGYSQRSMFKVRAEELVEDGEIRGLRVRRGEEDQEHPQKFLKPAPPDRLNLYRPQPENFIGNVTINVGWEGSTNLWEGRFAIDSLNIGLSDYLITTVVAADPGDAGKIALLVTEGYAMAGASVETVVTMGYAN